HQLNDMVGRGRDDREGPLPVARLRLPRLVEAGEEDETAIGPVEPDWLAVIFLARPLGKPLRWGDTEPFLENFPEGPPVGNRVRARVDLRRGPLCVFRPAVHQPPFRRSSLPLLAAQAHDPVAVRWRDVVARAIVLFRDLVDGNTELARQALTL